jgi:hypothetical protein
MESCRFLYTRRGIKNQENVKRGQKEPTSSTDILLFILKIVFGGAGGRVLRGNAFLSYNQ